MSYETLNYTLPAVLQRGGNIDIYPTKVPYFKEFVNDVTSMNYEALNARSKAEQNRLQATKISPNDPYYKALLIWTKDMENYNSVDGVNLVTGK